MTSFGTHCNFFIALSIRLKTYRSNDFLFFARQNVRARKIGRVSGVLRARARPIVIGRTICQGLKIAKGGHLFCTFLSVLITLVQKHQ